MSKKNKILIATAAALLLLAGGYYRSISIKNRAAGSDRSVYVSLGNLEGNELIRIEGNGITLERQAGEEWWEISYLEGGFPPGDIILDPRRLLILTDGLATIEFASLVDEGPEDISVYGLDKPIARTILTDYEGRKAEYILGEINPSRDSYYAMEAGNPGVYLISTNTADIMRFTLDQIQQKSMMFISSPRELTILRIESEGTLIEIKDINEWDLSYLTYLTAPFATHALTSPYKLARGVNIEALGKLTEPLGNFRVTEFIDSAPLSLAQYGLDKPARLQIGKDFNFVDLLVGSEHEGLHYAIPADDSWGFRAVITLAGMEIIKAKPFDLFDKYILPVNIDMVDQLTITGAEKTLNAGFQGTGSDAVFILNGRKAESGSFRNFYQTVTGLMADAEYPGPASNPVPGAEITIEFRLNNQSTKSASYNLIPYDRDFYSVNQEGAMEFLVSRSQVRRIFEAADAVVLE